MNNKNKVTVDEVALILSAHSVGRDGLTETEFNRSMSMSKLKEELDKMKLKTYEQEVLSTCVNLLISGSEGKGKGQFLYDKVLELYSWLTYEA